MWHGCQRRWAGLSISDPLGENACLTQCSPTSSNLQAPELQTEKDHNRFHSFLPGTGGYSVARISFKQTVTD